MKEIVWDKDMTCGGHTATVVQVNAAWNAWVAAGGGGYKDLAQHLVNVGAGVQGRPWPCHRIADRMMRQAKRGGFIDFNGRTWGLVQQQEDAA